MGSNPNNCREKNSEILGEILSSFEEEIVEISWKPEQAKERKFLPEPGQNHDFLNARAACDSLSREKPK